MKYIQRVLVVAAHPDDEVLGCGGTILKWVHHGAAVHFLFMTNGESARKGDVQREIIKRKNSAQKAAKILGAKELKILDFPDNQMDVIPLLQIIQSIEEAIKKYKPDTILTHFTYDLNVDHRLVSRAVITACRPQNGLSVKRILQFEVPSNTEWKDPSDGCGFQPTWFVDFSSFISKKRRALRCYAKELRDEPHPRSLTALESRAKWLGAISGCRFAEGFILVRNLA